LFSTTSPVAPPTTPLFSSSCIVARGCTPLYPERSRGVARHSPLATSHLIYSNALTNAQFASPFFSIQYKLPGGCTPSFLPNVQLSNLPTFKHSLPGVPLRRTPPSATMASVLAKDQETTPPLPVSKKSERTSGPVIVPSRSRVQLQVVPGSIVLEMDRRAGWLAIQQRVGKAGSVRLG
jgi:hypothetical protein